MPPSQIENKKKLVGIANAKSTVIRIFGAPTQDNMVFSTVGFVIHPASKLHMAIEGLIFVSSLVQLFLEPYLTSRNYASSVRFNLYPPIRHAYKKKDPYPDTCSLRAPAQGPAVSDDLVALSALCDICFIIHLFVGPLLGFTYFQPGHGVQVRLARLASPDRSSHLHTVYSSHLSH